MPIGNEQDIPVSGGSTPSLQQVTDVGSTTTNDFSLINGTFDPLVEIHNETGEGTIILSKNGVAKITLSASTEPSVMIGSSLGGESTLKSLATVVRVINFPDQSGTIALLSDITSGGITRSINNITGNTTGGATAATDYVYFCTGTLTLTLPTCVSNTNRYTIKCISGTLTINTTSSQTIDGSASISVAVEDSVDIISNNTEWKIV